MDTYEGEERRQSLRRAADRNEAPPDQRQVMRRQMHVELSGDDKRVGAADRRVGVRERRSAPERRHTS